MDTPIRSMVKALSWQMLGLFTMTGIAFVFTGNLGSAGGFALTAAVTGLVFFFLHERVWAAIPWGRRPDGDARESG